ncbi:MAG: TVP38/TMEM64 family protein [Deltaproteobacteria bacterium]|nr:TVP38/TMEM64 family protein [Deltaproteobacteria bacterium]MBW2018856.1 TVP38/TMEM64 family protein [Deltaproteobacteria bacterium]MBW2073611.1 TVP38/TMEM64 family protein [Deltaproteobacteria bacterium]
MTRRAKAVLVLSGTGFLGVVVCLICPPVWERVIGWYALVRDHGQVEAFLRAWGPVGAPIAFVGIQILQVVFAPIPGEASGFVGGYLFGTLPGFVYSTIGLTTGSAINFTIGRLLGRRYVAKWIPDNYLRRFDVLAKHQGAVLFFIFFVIPGFPKDYLCIFLGLTSLSAKVFILMAGIGRMPGTLMLSLQGAQVFQQDYTTLSLLVGITLAFALPAYFWRERIYQWIDRLNGVNSQIFKR